jgi:hypothetical protein
MFGQMMPVFTSPRCVNCHGGTNPATGVNHEPGPVETPSMANGGMAFDEKGLCQECHTTGTPSWHTAPDALSFVGKGALALCRQMRSTDAGSGFVNHIATDDLIGVGLVGQKGIGDDSPFGPRVPDSPPMSRADMVAAAKIWVEDGHAQCGSSWSGTVSVKTSSISHDDRQKGTNLAKDAAYDFSSTVTIVDGKGTADMHMKSHDFTDNPPNRPCWKIHYSSFADGTGDAEIQIIGEISQSSGGLAVAWTVPEATGKKHQELTTVPPACKANVQDQTYTVAKGFASTQILIDPTQPDDPNNPNHIFGHKAEKDLVGGGTTVYTWDLTKN